MRRSRLKLLLAALAVAAFSAVALAQESGVVADLSARIAELQARAQRLTALAQVPAEARPELEALMDRYEALRQTEQEVEVARLEALVAALEAGESPSVAREMADSAVAEQRVELAREREALNDDVEALVERYPDAAAEIRRLLMQRAYTAGIRIDGVGTGEFMALPALPGRPGSGVLRFRGLDGDEDWPGFPEGFRLVLPLPRDHR